MRLNLAEFSIIDSCWLIRKQNSRCQFLISPIFVPAQAPSAPNLRRMADYVVAFRRVLEDG